MNELPAVAVLISTYKQDDPYLFRRAMNSLVGQRYGGDINIYLAIDGPVDDALDEAIAAYEDRCVVTIRNERNQGLATSLNKLIVQLGDESFVFRMDADDVSLPDRFIRQVSYMRDNKDIDILGTAIREIDENGRFRRNMFYPSRPEQAKKAIARRNPLAHPTVCFRRHALDRVGSYPRTTMNQDWALWFRCLDLDMRLCSISDILVEMTVSDQFLKRRGRKRAIEELKISMAGIHKLFGYSPKMVYPLLRFGFRMLPGPLRTALYGSSLR